MKRKININRPEISSQEIAKRKNFDSVLKQANVGGGGKPFFKKPWFLSSAVVATVAVVATLAVLNKKSGTQNTEQVANSEQQTTGNPELEAFYKAEEAKPCINPPLPGVNVEYTVFKVIAEKGAELDFKTGSKLSIPKNAFADEKGNIIKGEVELRYREFHDAADFFVSGIPMTYDSAGVRYQFESAGMMEMLAYQNGKQVNMAPKKEITVELASSYKGSQYNLYKLDTNINNWSCLGKDKVVAQTIKASKSLEVQTNQKPEEKPEYKAIEAKKAEAEKMKDVQVAALAKPIAEPKKPAQVKKGKPTFDLDVSPEEFPELSIYKGLLFEVGEENKNFSTSMYDITWDEASIKEGNLKGENYLLTLKKGLKKYDLVVYPVFEGKNYETALKEYSDKFKKYTVALEKRKAEEKRITEQYEIALAKFKAEQDAIVRKMEEQAANQFKQMDTQEKVMRVFRVNSFGVYNSDCAGKYPQGVLCVANLKAEKDRDLQCYDIYLVDKQKNSLFTYARNPITAFSFNPQSTNMLWTVENGVLYWLKPEQFSTIKGGEGMSKLQMNRVEQKFTTPEELKAFFNL